MLAGRLRVVGFGRESFALGHPARVSGPRLRLLSCLANDGASWLHVGWRGGGVSRARGGLRSWRDGDTVRGASGRSRPFWPGSVWMVELTNAYWPADRTQPVVELTVGELLRS